MAARLVIAIALVAAPAHADVAPKDAARAAALFEQGQAAIAANKLEAACTMFDTSLRLDPQIGTRLNLADCRERQGRLVEAYALFVEAADEATRTNKPGRATFARDRAAALQMKLVRVTLRVAAPETPRLAIKLGGRELPRREWTKQQMMVPGAVSVDASAAGRDPVHVETTANAGAELEIRVPVLTPTEVVVERPTPAPRRSNLPWVIGGIGAAAVAASLGIGIDAKLRYDDARKRGDAAGVNFTLHEADVATGVGLAGAVTLAVGVVLYVRRDHDTVALVPGPGSFGLAVQLTTP